MVLDSLFLCLDVGDNEKNVGNRCQRPHGAPCVQQCHGCWDSTWAIALGNIISLIIFIIFGIYGNSWQEKSLVARRYEQVDTVTAANVEGTLALHLKSASAKR